jgi:hypothetical protein
VARRRLSSCVPLVFVLSVTDDRLSLNSDGTFGTCDVAGHRPGEAELVEREQFGCVCGELVVPAGMMQATSLMCYS